MRVLCNDVNDLLATIEASEVAVDNGISYGEDEEFPCPCLHVITGRFNIYVPMSYAQARSLALEAYANNKVDISPFANRTYYDPDAEEIEEIKELLASKAIGV